MYLGQPIRIATTCSFVQCFELYIFLFVWTIDCGIDIESKQPYRTQVGVKS